jgi:DNA-binding LacI/PurR family transcriptional regulator
LCSNDRIAIGFLSACYESGLRIGRGEDADLRVASHDDNPFSKFTCPSLTTAAHDFASVAGTAVETVFEVIESGGRIENRTETVFPARLVIRNSA